jgi:hypothetical protein
MEWTSMSFILLMECIGALGVAAAAAFDQKPAEINRFPVIPDIYEKSY